MNNCVRKTFYPLYSLVVGIFLTFLTFLGYSGIFPFWDPLSGLLSTFINPDTGPPERRIPG